MPLNAEQNQLEKQDNNGQTPVNLGGSGNTTGNQSGLPNVGNSTGNGRVANFSSGSSPNSSGSGRYTNLQKYLGANEGAGDRLYQGIDKKLGQASQTQKNEADKSMSAAADAFSQANQKVQQGQNYVNQLGSEGFNAGSIASDNDALADFSNYRTNQAIDSQALNKANTDAQTAYMGYQNKLNENLGKVGTETGRFEMLKNTFGGGSAYQNPYSTGQQRLDQLFLQASPNNNINKLQNTIRSDLSGANQQLNALENQRTNELSNIQNQSQKIAQDLQTQTGQMEQKLVQDIEAQQQAVNQARAQEIAYVQDQYAKLQSGQPVDQKFADMLGLQSGSRVGLVPNNMNVNQLFDLGALNATSANQLADDTQRQQYDAIAKLAGIENDAYRVNPYDQQVSPAVATNANTQQSFLDAQDAINKALSKTVGRNEYGVNVAEKSLADFEKALAASGMGGITGINALMNKIDNPNMAVKNQNLQSLIKNLYGNVPGTWSGSHNDPTAYVYSQAIYDMANQYMNQMNNLGGFNKVKINS